MPSEMRFADRVAIVTGAGNGLGRVYAIDLAKRGCKVVVNDLGGNANGVGNDAKAADAVVAEIKALGGVAVANYDSVLNGGAIVKTAIDNFGRVDIVVNNAGILRDIPFARMTEKDWQLIMDVHLNGVYAVTKAAYPHMMKQKYGRIVMVSSAVGLYGNFGQANYGTVKLGVVGFANTLAKEGAKNNISTNVIAPIAASRMTAKFLPPDVVDSLKPEYVSPLVQFLCHDSCKENGAVFEVGGGWVSKVRWERSKGVFFPLNTFSIESVGQQIAQISDFSEPSYPTSLNDTMMPLIERAASGGAAPAPATAAPAVPAKPVAAKPAAPAKKAGGDSKIDVAAALAHKFEPFEGSYTSRDTVLYALGIGAASDPLDQSELQYTYELGTNYQVLPTFGVVVPSPALSQFMTVPALSFNPMMLLHGEQYLEVRKPLQPSDTLVSLARISSIYDKGSGALVSLDVTSKNKAGEEVLFNQFSFFIRGLGKFGGDKGPAPVSYDPPAQTPPEVVHREKTLDNQALLYRLSGDYNPLHADPAMASVGGFNKPILHGLCTLGYASRAVIKHYCGNDASRFRSIRVRFVKHVFPGETLVTEMWRNPKPSNPAYDEVLFRVKVAERGDYVLSNAVIQLYRAGGAAAAPAAAAPAAAAGAGKLVDTKSGFKAEPIFLQLQERASVDLVKKVGATFRFDLTKGGATKRWLLDLKNGSGSISVAEETTKSEVTIAMSDDDFPELMSGKLNAQQAFMKGKLKIKGNIMLAQKLSLITPKPSKL